MTTTIQRDFFKHMQSWCLTLITEEQCGTKLRVQIRRNAYDDQSQAVCSVWSTTRREWTEVVRKPITACRCASVSYVTPAPDQALFDADADMLRAMALLVIGVPSKEQP